MQATELDTINSLTMDNSAAAMSIEHFPVEQPVVSLFTEHLLKPENGLLAVERAAEQTDFVLLILAICGGLVIYIHRNSDGIFSSIFRGSFDSNLAMQESRVDNSQRTRNVILLQLVTALSMSLMISAIISIYSTMTYSLVQVYFSVLGGLILAVSIKKGIQWLLANFFQLSGVLKSHHFNTNILMAASGLLLLPLSVLLFFSPFIPSTTLIYTSISIFGFFYLKTLQRGLSITLSTNSVSPLHLFYYFCALEMPPVFVLIRLAFEL